MRKKQPGSPIIKSITNPIKSNHNNNTNPNASTYSTSSTTPTLSSSSSSSSSSNSTPTPTLAPTNLFGINLNMKKFMELVSGSVTGGLSKLKFPQSWQTSLNAFTSSPLITATTNMITGNNNNNNDNDNDNSVDYNNNNNNNTNTNTNTNRHQQQQQQQQQNSRQRHHQRTTSSRVNSVTPNSTMVVEHYHHHQQQNATMSDATPTQPTKQSTNLLNINDLYARIRASTEDASIKAWHLTPEGGTSSQRIYDCCAYVIHCPTHERVAICRPRDTNVAWLPYTVLPSNCSWHEGALFGSYLVLSDSMSKQFFALKDESPYSVARLMEVFRFQLATTKQFITRLTLYIRLNNSNVSSSPAGMNNNNSRFVCCQNTDRLQWIPLNTLRSGMVENIWGPEVVDFSRWVMSPAQHPHHHQQQQQQQQKIHEYGLERALFYVPRDPPRNLEEAMLKSAGITEKDVERLYVDFIDHCFPAFFMTIWSFKAYMLKYGFEHSDARLIRLFNAFNFNGNGFLSFHELLLGLASIEPFTAHGEARVKFIFRYYDTKNKGVLLEHEFRRMVRDIYPRIKNEHELEGKIRECARCFKIQQIDGKFGISYEDFFQSVGTHRFRGTSALCRAKKPVFAHISRLMAARQLEVNAKNQRTKLGVVIKNRFHHGICTRCRERQYTLWPYTVRLNAAHEVGKLERITSIHTLPLPPPPPPSSSPPQTTTTTTTTTTTFIKPRLEIFFTQPEHAAVTLINTIRRFNINKGTYQNPRGLLAEQMPRLFELFQLLSNEVMPLLKAEPRCPIVASPCFVIGDIHGNLEDLLSLEHCLWRRMPLLGTNLVFLGDYVDRGKWSVECALYVLSLKVLMPNQVTLLRGNHEVRPIQMKYSFRAECAYKYGDRGGERVWDMFNQIFDRMPVGAIVDDSFFCAHGGIPCSGNGMIDEINRQPVDIRMPEQDSPLVWEMMWSDPIVREQFLEVCDFFLVDPNTTKGFVRNSKRGTAYYFNEIGAGNFLQANNLTHIIRAHEVPANGFTFHFGDRCITIFSCSHYCGNNNECACLLIDRETVRIIRIDTHNNAPATDPC